MFSCSLGSIDLDDVVALDFSAQEPGKHSFVLHLRPSLGEVPIEALHSISMLEDEEPAPSSLLLLADSPTSLAYWRAGLLRACPAAAAAAVAATAGSSQAPLEGKRAAEQPLPRALRDSDVAPPPQVAALLSWIKRWAAGLTEAQLLTCDLLLFASGKDVATGVAEGSSFFPFLFCLTLFW